MPTCTESQPASLSDSAYSNGKVQISKSCTAVSTTAIAPQHSPEKPYPTNAEQDAKGVSGYPGQEQDRTATRESTATSGASDKGQPEAPSAHQSNTMDLKAYACKFCEESFVTPLEWRNHYRKCGPNQSASKTPNLYDNTTGERAALKSFAGGASKVSEHGIPQPRSQTLRVAVPDNTHKPSADEAVDIPAIIDAHASVASSSACIIECVSTNCGNEVPASNTLCSRCKKLPRARRAPPRTVPNSADNVPAETQNADDGIAQKSERPQSCKTLPVHATPPAHQQDSTELQSRTNVSAAETSIMPEPQGNQMQAGRSFPTGKGKRHKPDGPTAVAGQPSATANGQSHAIHATPPAKRGRPKKLRKPETMESETLDVDALADSARTDAVGCDAKNDTAATSTDGTLGRKKKGEGKGASMKDVSVREKWNGSDALDLGHIVVALDRTLHWYKAIVIAAKETEVKVHFIGWKPRFDEWMHRDSEKIRVLEDKEYTLDVAETRPPVDSKRPAGPSKNAKHDIIDMTIVVKTEEKKIIAKPKSSKRSQPQRRYGFDVAPSAVACGFCGMKGDGGLLKQSDMLGPFVQKRKEVYAHHQCLIWAPGVAESMDKVLMGVNQAVAASLTRNCDHCSNPGAAISCMAHRMCVLPPPDADANTGGVAGSKGGGAGSKGGGAAVACKRRYHYHCMVAAGCVPVLESYSCLCPEHRCVVDTPQDIGAVLSTKANVSALLNTIRKDLACLKCLLVSDIEHMLFCTTCGARYHTMCLDDMATVDIAKARPMWQCPNCKTCRTCQKMHDDVNMVVCDSCDGAWHIYCAERPLAKVPTQGWKCVQCTKCIDCGTTTAKRWCRDFTMCSGCSRLHKLGHVCPVCSVSYHERTNINMVCCDSCAKWVHCDCDGISDDAYKFMATDDRKYFCPVCRKAEGARKEAERKKLIEEVLRADPQVEVVDETSGRKTLTKSGRGSPLKKRQRVKFNQHALDETIQGGTDIECIHGNIHEHERVTHQPKEPGVITGVMPICHTDAFLSEHDVCGLCGGRGSDDEGYLLFCIQCGEAYHPFCIDANFVVSEHALTHGWRCAECIECLVCRGEGKEAQILMCEGCQRGCHIFCCNPPLSEVPDGEWRCVECVKCRSCGIKKSKTWHENYTLCAACNSYRKKSKLCTICNKSYHRLRRAAVTHPLISCANCPVHVHARCEGIEDGDLARLMGGRASGADCLYHCRQCRREQRGRNKRSGVPLLKIDSVQRHRAAMAARTSMKKTMLLATEAGDRMHKQQRSRKRSGEKPRVGRSRQTPLAAMSQDIRDVVAFLVDHTELRFLEMDAPSTAAVRSDDNTGGAVVGVDEDKDGPDTQADIATLAHTHYQAHMVDTDEDTGETVVVDLFDPVETPDVSVETDTTSASMTAVLPSMGDVFTVDTLSAIVEASTHALLRDVAMETLAVSDEAMQADRAGYAEALDSRGKLTAALEHHTVADNTIPSKRDMGAVLTPPGSLSAHAESSTARRTKHNTTSTALCHGTHKSSLVRGKVLKISSVKKHAKCTSSPHAPPHTARQHAGGSAKPAGKNSARGRKRKEAPSARVGAGQKGVFDREMHQLTPSVKGHVAALPAATQATDAACRPEQTMATVTHQHGASVGCVGHPTSQEDTSGGVFVQTLMATTEPRANLSTGHPATPLTDNVTCSHSPVPPAVDITDGSLLFAENADSVGRELIRQRYQPSPVCPSLDPTTQERKDYDRQSVRVEVDEPMDRASHQGDGDTVDPSTHSLVDAAGHCNLGSATTTAPRSAVQGNTSQAPTARAQQAAVDEHRDAKRPKTHQSKLHTKKRAKSSTASSVGVSVQWAETSSGSGVVQSTAAPSTHISVNKSNADSKTNTALEARGGIERSTTPKSLVKRTTHVTPRKPKPSYLRCRTMGCPRFLTTTTHTAGHRYCCHCRRRSGGVRVPVVGSVTAAGKKVKVSTGKCIHRGCTNVLSSQQILDHVRRCDACRAKKRAANHTAAKGSRTEPKNTLFSMRAVSSSAGKSKQRPLEKKRRTESKMSTHTDVTKTEKSATDVLKISDDVDVLDVGKSSRSCMHGSGKVHRPYFPSNIKHLHSDLGDERQCILCRNTGDGDPTLCGRLVPAGVDRWIHVNCAVWSAECVELADGGIDRVAKAVARSRLLRCTLCGKTGATVGCHHRTCRGNFHLPCAKAAGCVFLDSRAVFCSDHTSSRDRRKVDVVVSDLSVRRRVYVMRDIKKETLKGQQQGMRIRMGSLTVLSTGDVVFTQPAFHCHEYIYPAGFSARRVYWSTTQPNARCLYECTVSNEGERPVFQVASVQRANQPRNERLVLRTESPQTAWASIQTKVNALRALTAARSEGTVMSMPSAPTSSNARLSTAPCDDFPTSRATNTVIRPPGVMRAASDGASDTTTTAHPTGGIKLGKNEATLFGFTEAVQRWIEDLPGAGYCDHYRFQSLIRSKRTTEATTLPGTHVNATGCARSEGFDRKERERYNLIHRSAAERRLAEEILKMRDAHTNIHSISRSPDLRRDVSQDVPVEQQYAQLRERASANTFLSKSRISGWGLHAARVFQAGEMVIEYIGEVVRQQISEHREAYYNSKGIGCYMFGIANTDLVIDGTMKGGHARFINHSCEANCVSKLLYINGVPKIIICAIRDIAPLEEFAYDYKFEWDDTDKVPCNCGSTQCRGWMN